MDGELVAVGFVAFVRGLVAELVVVILSVGLVVLGVTALLDDSAKLVGAREGHRPAAILETHRERPLPLLV